ncbi:hypothetical protein [Clavibacter zhangzhiyongii]|jgi:hypothetical protein|uniref:hypothetical protein n=1 Tax=Clavibacter zhangzhiyongii TaxID=2768071 RepID=UPI0039E172C2
MPTRYASEAANIAISGPESHRLATIAEKLLEHGVPAALLDETSAGPTSPITCAIVAESFDPDIDHRQWRERAEDTAASFGRLLEAMASLSTAVVIAYSTTDDRRGRARVREALARMLSTLEAQAATINGIDFTVNGIEVPLSADHELLEARLEEFARRRSSLSSGSVIPVEDLRRDPLQIVLAASVL